MAATVVAVAALLVGTGLSTSFSRADALSGSQFDPGNIISDSVFFDSGAMSEAQIQAFLDSKVGTCSNTRCLNVLKTTTATRAGDAMCGTYTGAASESAARIIAKVSAACGINPRVFLVTLQKEQGLVTAKAPSASTIDRAMGYGCPDNAAVPGTCDPAYGGLYNQLYKAAWQFKRYANPVGTTRAFTSYTPGKTVSVRYSPSSPCGARSVTIQNQATANLYYYTPYTPNPAALANISGTGDGCSSYGNRNFWVYFSNWFGSPTQSATATGHVDAVAGGRGLVTVKGWALDPSTTAPATVEVRFGSSVARVTANASRPDVGAVYPASGPLHGFSTTMAASPGTADVCVYQVVTGGATALIACSSTTVTNASPIGALDSAAAVPGGIRVSGWAADPDTTAPIGASISIDSRVVTTITASTTRADVGAVHPELGSAHGYSTIVAAAAGMHTVCVTGKNVAAGADAQVGTCRVVRVPSTTPSGNLDAVSTTARSIRITGWVLDADQVAPIRAAVYIDGRGVGYSAAAGARSDVAALYPAYGAGHGFDWTYAVTPGRHTICVYGINAGTTGSNALLGCRTVVTDVAPVGVVDRLVGGSKSVAVSGWAYDPDAPTTSITMAIYIDGKGSTTKASLARVDVARAKKLSSPYHGFSTTIPATAGRHTVCVYAIDTAGGSNPQLKCSVVAVG